MTSLKLYNTLTRQKEPFQPIDAANIRMYVCGPTVYDFAHIGNARPVIVFDVLFRLLRHLYGESHVTYARNITDVDDKINDRAVRDFPELPLNEAIRRVTEGTNAQYQADVTALGCLPPTHQPRATEHLDEMRALCERLVERGFAYVAEGHVLFSPEAMNAKTGTWPVYGKLANRSLDEMIAGARVDVAPYKRGATDFVLWKPSEAGQPGWPSPCGIETPGRPGWHIECSAMSGALLGEVFDIHAGGLDLIFPHHENEIAQSCCAFGKPGQPNPLMAKYWMHNGFLQVEGQKMSKSLGNFRTIREVLADWPGEVARLNMLKTHYRDPIDWTDHGLAETQSELNRWYAVAHIFPSPSDAQIDDGFVAALMDDLNTHAAITVMRDLFKRHLAEEPYAGQKLTACGRLMGLFQTTYPTWLTQITPKVLEIKDRAKVDSLIDARLAARNAKNFAESDRIRDELVAMGIQIMDAKDPITGELKTTWEVKR